MPEQNVFTTDTHNIPFTQRPTSNDVKPSFLRSASSASNATTHMPEEITEGCIINHTRFGRGMVLSLDCSSDPKIIVKFDDAGIKTLLLKFAKFNIIQ